MGNITVPQTYNLKYKATKEISNPAKEGYTFNNWTITGTSRTTISGTTLTMGENASTITANYTPNKYTLTVNNGISTPTTEQINCDGTKTINNPTREGYTFTGWTVSSTKASLSGTALTMGAEDVTLTANWTVNSYPWIAYHNKQNVTGVGYTLVEADTESGSANFGTTVTPNVKNYTGFTSPSEQAITIQTANNRVDYNYGRNKYNLVINPNGGTYSKSVTTSLYYEQEEVLGTITKTGYNASWSKTGSGTLTDNVLKQGVGETTLTANWTAQTYTLTFNANGGSVSPSSKTITYGEVYGELPIPTRNGYQFLGWYTMASGGTKIDSSTIVSVTTSQTLYAHWEQLTLLKSQILTDNPGFDSTRNVTSKDMFTYVSPSDGSQNGLWKENRSGKTENNLPTYFFRGSVSNNYVSFAGKMWRIVRINEDGTIKLILGGNNTTDGYIDNNVHTYGSSINYSTSGIKNDLDTWYSSNITGTYGNNVSLSLFCNDKTSSVSGSYTNYGAYTRLYENGDPQFKCPNSSDNSSYLIGGLTADEVTYAGGAAGFLNQNSAYYLYDNAQRAGNSGTWWVISPYYYFNGAGWSFYVFGSNNAGGLGSNGISFSVGLRAVLSLKADTVYTTGNGTQSNPYVIS